MEMISDYQPILLCLVTQKKKKLGYQDIVQYSIMIDQKIEETSGLFKSFEFGNGSSMSDEELVIPGNNTEKIWAHRFLTKPKTSTAGGLSEVNNRQSSDMSDRFYVAVRHLKIEI